MTPASAAWARYWRCCHRVRVPRVRKRRPRRVRQIPCRAGAALQRFRVVRRVRRSARQGRQRCVRRHAPRGHRRAARPPRTGHPGSRRRCRCAWAKKGVDRWEYHTNNRHSAMVCTSLCVSVHLLAPPGSRATGPLNEGRPRRSGQQCLVEPLGIHYKYQLGGRNRGRTRFRIAGESDPGELKGIFRP
jgi:hypothetical protein